MLLPIALTPFEYVGIVLAAWAVIVAAVGTMKHDFPAGDGLEKAVMGISVLLVAGAIGSAVLGGEKHDNGGAEATGNENKAGKEGSEGGSGTPAPDTRPEDAQSGSKAPAPDVNAQTLKLTADASGQLAFDKKTLSAKPGNVTIEMTNPSPVPHDISIEGPNNVARKGKEVEKGGTSTVSSDLKAGDYTFYCSVPGHRQGGMEGKLTVK
jgi:plastocyanin